MPLLRLAGLRFRGWARCGVFARRLPGQSGLRLAWCCRKRLRGLFRTNLPALSWFVSSGLINLLLLRPAINVQPRFASHPKQGLRRAGTAVPAPNCFLLRPTTFHYTWAQGSGGNARRGFTGESGLFLSALRAGDFLLFFAAIAVLLGVRLTQRDSAIQRPNVSSHLHCAKRRGAWTYAAPAQDRTGNAACAGAEWFNTR
jgi:hypothetical protein